MDEKIKEIAVKAAIVGGDILRCYFRSQLAVDIKNELSPLVSKADKEAEEAIRSVISNAFPTHIITGEEFDDYHPKGSDQATITWTIDPIDGTTAYLSGIPTFVVLIGVWQGDNPLLGVMYQPLTKDMWVGTKGETTLNEKPIKVDDYPNLPMIMATTSPEYLSKPTKRAFDKMSKLAFVTLYGGDGLLYGSLACGRISLIVEEGLKWHDVSALVPIIIGAGGSICDLSGAKIEPTKRSYSIIASVSKSITKEFQSIFDHSDTGCSTRNGDVGRAS